MIAQNTTFNKAMRQNEFKRFHCELFLLIQYHFAPRRKREFAPISMPFQGRN